MAIFNDKGVILEKEVIVIDNLNSIIEELNNKYQFKVIVIGDRTNSKKIQEQLSFLNIPIKTVDENNSSVEGRYRYFEENTKGFGRLIPIGLRTTKYPYDDYVAVVLGERFLKENNLSLKREEPL